MDNQDVVKTVSVSLDDLDATKHGAEAFEFEYINKSGNATGIFFKVLGGESEAVKTETALLQNERRRKQAARDVTAKIGVGAKKVEFEPFESDVAYGRRLSAVRLVGWRGIKDPFTKENALRLVQNNDHIASAITEASEAMENFIKL